ncbi:hypothetical protein ACFYOV_05330 [Streptomyces sp. NPDC005931]|uniref:hypothetical protein n=1 Tax=Streptomyces sp. NPDC005931 TaxID=3364737 RepID=UPI0036BE4E89
MNASVITRHYARPVAGRDDQVVRSGPAPSPELRASHADRDRAVTCCASRRGTVG